MTLHPDELRKIRRIPIGDQFHYDVKKMNEINKRIKQEIEKNNNPKQYEPQPTETPINPDYITP